MDESLFGSALVAQPEALASWHPALSKRTGWIWLALLFAPSPLYAQGTAGDPWDNAVQVLQAAFTSTIARGLSLVAIVVGGLSAAPQKPGAIAGFGRMLGKHPLQGAFPEEGAFRDGGS